MDPMQKLLDMATEQGLLHPISVDPVRLRTSMYADDTTLFLRPHASDVHNLRSLLQPFGVATGLSTNIQKLEIIPICCDGLDLPEILGPFQARLTNLPCRYLGLPLRLGRLRKDDEQVLIDRVATKLPNWEGKLLNKAGRLMLVNSVLSGVVTYHMTVFRLSKWALKKIDRIRWQFLWHCADSTRHGHILIHWKRVTHPKKMGGLETMELERFNMALRLRWPWLQWSAQFKPWQRLPPQSTKSEMALFRMCTTILA
jgi:hypothetical protein